MATALDERILRIEHWSIKERSIRYWYNSDPKSVCIGMIVGMWLAPNRKFSAQILIFGAEYTYHGSANMGWREMGTGVGEYQFIDIPEDVQKLLDQMKPVEKPEKVEPEPSKAVKTEDKTEDGFLDGETETPTSLPDGREGHKRVPAVKSSRLSKDT